MKTLRWIVLALIVFISCQANAQAKLGITIDAFPTQIAHSDSGMQQQLIMHIYNDGDSVFNNTVSLQYKLDTTLYSADTNGSGIYFQAQAISLGIGDSVQEALYIDYNLTPFYEIGSSAVVIWPISNGAATFDSLSYLIQVTPVAGITPVAAQNLHVFINQGQLFINTNTPNLLNRVRIYDIEGQLLMEQRISSSTIIPMNNYASDCYLIEVILSDESRQVFKAVNINNR
jgi:hypothetical protein